MEFISDNVSIDTKEGRLSVVISQTLEGWRKSVFVTWFVFWSLCGVFFIMALVSEPSRDTKLAVFILLVFWAYYAWRIGKALMWRLRGVEQWRVNEGVLTVKDSINGYGKARKFFADNISEFGTLNIDESSWKWQMSNSFWQIGGERIGFLYNGKRIAIGKGLSANDARKVADKVSAQLKKAGKSQS